MLFFVYSNTEITQLNHSPLEKDGGWGCMKHSQNPSKNRMLLTTIEIDH